MSQSLYFDSIAEGEVFIERNGKRGLLVTHTSTDPATKHLPKLQHRTLVGIRYASNRFGTHDLTEAEALAATRESAPVARVDAVASERAQKAVAARAATRGTPRYVELLGALRNGPVTLDEVMEKWQCTQAAASSLFNDVKNKCGANVVRDGRTYRLD